MYVVWGSNRRIIAAMVSGFQGAYLVGLKLIPYSCHWNSFTYVSRIELTFNFIILTKLACGYVSFARGLLPNAEIGDPVLRAWTITYWSLDFTVNAVATSSIVFRLWSIGRSVQAAGNHRNKYLGAILTLVESGALYFSMTTVLFNLILTENTTVVPVLDIAAQLAVCPVI